MRKHTGNAAARSVNDPTAKGKGPPVREPDETRPAPSSRTEAVKEALRQAIIEQKLQPGTRLPEDTVGNSFGTSRTIAREALGRLAVEGLIELKPNRGAYVANPSLEEGHDTFLVRRSLERTVTGLLAGRLNPSDIDRLNAFVDREEKASGTESKESIRLAGEFHLLLARMTGNHLLIRYVTEVVSRCSLILAMYGRPHSADCGVEEHRGIISALAKGKGDKASHVMDDHLTSVAARAKLAPRPESDIRNVLAPYAEGIKGRPA
jgi:DNA-binding GntR family transcriptional regulator